jgi:hypothetical protein
MDAIRERVPAETDEATFDAITWAICPHICRWSDPNWHEYAPQHRSCDLCPESETIGGYDTTCPWRHDAEEAAKAVLQAMAVVKGK